MHRVATVLDRIWTIPGDTHVPEKPPFGGFLCNLEIFWSLWGRTPRR